MLFIKFQVIKTKCVISVVVVSPNGTAKNNTQTNSFTVTTVSVFRFYKEINL